MSALAAVNWSPIRAVMQWCKQHAAERGLDLRSCGDEEIEQMAKDIAIAPAELVSLARSGPHAADLLLSRMAALDLDRAEVCRTVPRTFQDLQRVCTLCSKHRRCAHDLARSSIDPVWKSYCPNVGTLMALDAMPWASRNEW